MATHNWDSPYKVIPTNPTLPTKPEWAKAQVDRIRSQYPPTNEQVHAAILDALLVIIRQLGELEEKTWPS